MKRVLIGLVVLSPFCSAAMETTAMHREHFIRSLMLDHLRKNQPTPVKDPSLLSILVSEAEVTDDLPNNCAYVELVTRKKYKIDFENTQATVQKIN